MIFSRITPPRCRRLITPPSLLIDILLPLPSPCRQLLKATLVCHFRYVQNTALILLAGAYSALLSRFFFFAAADAAR